MKINSIAIAEEIVVANTSTFFFELSFSSQFSWTRQRQENK